MMDYSSDKILFKQLFVQCKESQYIRNKELFYLNIRSEMINDVKINELLRKVEEFQKSEEQYDEQCVRGFVCSLAVMSSMSLIQFGNNLEYLLSKKRVVFVRHAESVINVWVEHNPIKFMLSLYPRDPRLYNPGLTRKGLLTCSYLAEKLKDDPPFELIVTSPYERTIATLDRVRHVPSIQKVQNTIVSHLIRERASIPASVVGYKRSHLVKTRDDLDSSRIPKDIWWKKNHQKTVDPMKNNYTVEQNGQCTAENKESHYLETMARETDTLLLHRMLLFLIWISLRSEKHIVFFSHCSVYEALKLFKVPKPKNAHPYLITAADARLLYDTLLINKSRL